MKTGSIIYPPADDGDSRPIQLVIFDMDGTIVNSMSSLQALAVDVMSRFYPGFLPEELETMYRTTTGIPFLEQLHQIFKGSPENVKAANTYELEHAEIAHTFPVATSVDLLLDTLRNHLIHTALVSATHRYILDDKMPQIQALGFDYTAGFLTGYGKQNQIHLAMRHFDVDAYYTLYVGDSPADADYARNANVRFLPVEHSITATAVHAAIRANNLKETPT